MKKKILYYVFNRKLSNLIPEDGKTGTVTSGEAADWILRCDENDDPPCDGYEIIVDSVGDEPLVSEKLEWLYLSDPPLG